MILTAAHCSRAFDEETDKVKIGATIWDESASNTVIIANIVHSVIHESWNEAGHQENDIAVLWIDIDLSQYSFVEEVSIFKSIYSSGECCAEGGDVRVIGYGKQCYSDSCTPTKTLEYVDLEYIFGATCREQFGKYADEIGSKMNCATKQNIGPCRGDSGGPMIIPGTNHQVGILSWGVKCNSYTYWGLGSAYPSVYTDVSKYTEWLSTQKNENFQVTTNAISTLVTGDYSWAWDDSKSYAECPDNIPILTSCELRSGNYKIDGSYEK